LSRRPTPSSRPQEPDQDIDGHRRHDGQRSDSSTIVWRQTQPQPVPNSTPGRRRRQPQHLALPLLDPRMVTSRPSATEATSTSRAPPTRRAAAPRTTPPAAAPGPARPAAASQVAHHGPARRPPRAPASWPRRCRTSCGCPATRP
jgi:hypothetical protein